MTYIKWKIAEFHTSASTKRVNELEVVSGEIFSVWFWFFYFAYDFLSSISHFNTRNGSGENSQRQNVYIVKSSNPINGQIPLVALHNFRWALRRSPISLLHSIFLTSMGKFYSHLYRRWYFPLHRLFSHSRKNGNNRRVEFPFHFPRKLDSI